MPLHRMDYFFLRLTRESFKILITKPKARLRTASLRRESAELSEVHVASQHVGFPVNPKALLQQRSSVNSPNQQSAAASAASIARVARAIEQLKS